ncbi:hypothetical protein K7X08_009328 [Anisodus acutangulus]|uniref:Protein TRIGALACTOSYLDIACYLGLYCEROL 1, chloroplastic n=1 Tax=Anisodus acutangulus TaxID=402998 RepID=A0A9Q1MZ40_9SOLA|nr:hypothetical protein K7X08_009328 [Anisodus acutangulus]
MQAASHCHPLLHFSARGRYSTVSNHARVKVLTLNWLPQKFDFNQGAKIQKVLKSSKSKRFYVILNSKDGYPSLCVPEEDTTASKKDTSTVGKWESGGETFLCKWSPPREFTRLGLNRSVGGVLALAFSRELSPVVIAVVVAGRIGSAFAAELGTMQVSEQTDTLRVLGANPVDYLVTPRVIASCIALPFFTLMCFTVGMASSALLADGVYGTSINIILDSAQRALRSWDLISAMIKSQVFGAIISIISCAWGVTTLGGAKGVGESTTSAVVLSLVGIFIADFALSCCFFQGAGDSLRKCV